MYFIKVDYYLWLSCTFELVDRLTAGSAQGNVVPLDNKKHYTQKRHYNIFNLNEE